MKINKLLKIFLTLFLIFISIPLIHLIKTKIQETEITHSIPKGYTNDESHLNLTKIDSIFDVGSNPKEIKTRLKSILLYAKENNLKVSIAGAKHSMGGHTINNGGVIINMLPYNHMSLDSNNNVLTIGSGALWEDALNFLDKKGKSIYIMQAFSSFSIGGSISVNGHGWQKNLPPVSHSILSFTLLNAEGKILNCSQSENKELFKLVIGGYGLFGIILDIKLKVVDNEALKFKYIHLATSNYLNNYEKFVTNNPNTELVFGRLRISEKKFLEEATLNFFEKTNLNPNFINDKHSNELKRVVFRGSVNSEYGKRLRWDLETSSNRISKNNITSRNKLLNDNVNLIQNKDTSSTDILHEYFIPERNFNKYVNEIKPILRNSEIDLLNITIRRVNQDTISYMNYAREDVYGFVILFNQKKTQKHEDMMIKLTQELTNATYRNSGTVYLPYRLHLDKKTFRKIYPQADNFFALKLKYDPQELFTNLFYSHYK
tara:strand:+ start:4099 stop:5562 length:1464 start_codon:yes stop_codon:yes gene_type:complete